MALVILLSVLSLLTVYSYSLGRKRALKQVDGRIADLHSRPGYYGVYMALWTALPAVIALSLWLIIDDFIIDVLVVAQLPQEVQRLPGVELGLIMNDIRNAVAGSLLPSKNTSEIRDLAHYYASLQEISFIGVASFSFALIGFGIYWSGKAIHPSLRARNTVERVVMTTLLSASTLAIFTTIGIILSLLVESWRFFQAVPFYEFLFGTHWSPQIAIRADQTGSSGAFGAVPIFAGTFMISFIAMTVAAPIGLMSAIFLAEYATPGFRAVVKPLLEILAGIPTVVYGFFAALVVAPQIRGIGENLGLDVASESALAAGLVMGIMIIPFVSSLSDDVISAVPNSLREGSFGLGATKSETIKRVVLPAALPGIVGSFLLAVSRAIGETMIVVMAAGLAANLTANPLQAVTTVTVQIVTLLIGDQEFDSPKTLAAFALGLVLFFITLCLNVIALRVVRKYREQYD